jgi:hypothetical protein
MESRWQRPPQSTQMMVGSGVITPVVWLSCV